MFTGILAAYLLALAVRQVAGKRAAARALQSAHARSAARLHRGFVELEGVYVKLGQVISMMTSFLPEIYLTELEGMQDAVPPRPFDKIRQRIEDDLGPVGELYEDIDPVPVASASLGQVHIAILPGGREVAVKVQYPGIDRVVNADLAMIGFVLRVVGWFLRGLRTERIHRDISDTIRGELVYTREGNSAERIADHFKGETHVLFPTIVWTHTCDTVLTMECMHGSKITDLDGLRADGLDPRDVIQRLVESYFKQLLLDGLYHADPHPGNFFVTKAPDGKPAITFLDFGAVAELPAELRDGMRVVVKGYMSRNDRMVITGMRQMGFASAGADDRVFETAVRHYMDKLLHLDVRDFSRIDVRDFDVWRNLDEMKLSFRELAAAFEVPRSWFYVERTLALLLGLCARLDPKVDAFLYGFPYAIRFVFGDDPALASLWGTPEAPVYDPDGAQEDAAEEAEVFLP